MVAAGKGLGETVKRLLQRGADANQKNKDGGTAMMYAANAEVLGLLLKHGGEVNLQDLRGSTALMLAAGSGQEQIVELLLGLQVQVLGARRRLVLEGHLERPRLERERADRVLLGDARDLRLDVHVLLELRLEVLERQLLPAAALRDGVVLLS